jgi:hypothetical protein
MKHCGVAALVRAFGSGYPNWDGTCKDLAAFVWACSSLRSCCALVVTVVSPTEALYDTDVNAAIEEMRTPDRRRSWGLTSLAR